MNLVITDASHANESEEMIINEMTSVEGYRSQGARMVFLGPVERRQGSHSSYLLVKQPCAQGLQIDYTGGGLYLTGRS